MIYHLRIVSMSPVAVTQGVSGICNYWAGQKKSVLIEHILRPAFASTPKMPSIYFVFLRVHARHKRCT